MGHWDAGRLSQQQADLVSSLFGAPELIADLSWGQMDTKVLHVRDGGTHVIVKAAGAGNHHIGREITAHSSWTGPLVSQGWTARLLYSKRELNLLVLNYLDGSLVEGTRLELDEDTHAQAGKIPESTISVLQPRTFAGWRFSSGSNGRASKQLSWPGTVTTRGTRMPGGSICFAKL